MSKDSLAHILELQEEGWGLGRKDETIIATAFKKARAEIKRLTTALKQAQAEVERLQKGIAVSIAYCDIYYCANHQDWRIQGYTFGCGDKHG